VHDSAIGLSIRDMDESASNMSVLIFIVDNIIENYKLVQFI